MLHLIPFTLVLIIVTAPASLLGLVAVCGAGVSGRLGRPSCCGGGGGRFCRSWLKGLLRKHVLRYLIRLQVLGLCKHRLWRISNLPWLLPRLLLLSLLILLLLLLPLLLQELWHLVNVNTCTTNLLLMLHQQHWLLASQLW
jgi:hypothetical protein